MNIVGVLPWYDEQPSMLGPCVAGFARFIDTLIAVDGAYALYPGARAMSHPSQAETILRTCEAAGVECVLHRPRDVWWGNEVEKRNMTLQLARPFCDENSWIVAIDSDYNVLQVTPEVVRHELEQTDLHVAYYTILSGKDLVADEKLAEFARAKPLDTEWTMRTRGFYRWADDMAYGPRHWTISGTYDGEKRWVYGPDLVPGEGGKVLPAHDLGSSLVVYHRREDRPKVRHDAAEEYYRVREECGVETEEFSFDFAS